MDFDDKDLFKEDNIPQSNWFKFDKVGDKVGGEVSEIFDKPGSGDFPDQRVFVLRQKDGSMINVGIKKTSDYIIGRTNNVKLGDILGFEFKKEIPAKVKGHHPAKSIEVYVKHVEAPKEFGSFGD